MQFAPRIFLNKLTLFPSSFVAQKTKKQTKLISNKRLLRKCNFNPVFRGIY